MVGKFHQFLRVTYAGAKLGPTDFWYLLLRNAFICYADRQNFYKQNIYLRPTLDSERYQKGITSDLRWWCSKTNFRKWFEQLLFQCINMKCLITCCARGCLGFPKIRPYNYYKPAIEKINSLNILIVIHIGWPHRIQVPIKILHPPFPRTFHRIEKILSIHFFPFLILE